MVKRQMKICLTSLIIGELQNQNYSELSPHTCQNGCHQKKKKSTDNKCWRGCGKKEILLHYLWKCKLVQPLWKTVWRFLEKLKIELSYDPEILLLGINLEKTIFCKDTCSLIFIAMLFAIFQGISILFSIVAALVCIPTNSVGGFPFLHTLSSIYCLQIFGLQTF